MPSHSDYQPLLQHEDDDDDDDDRTDALPQPVTASHSTRRRNRSGSVDLKTLDVAFKKSVLASVNYAYLVADSMVDGPKALPRR
jgi:hypothetical protein